MDELAKHSSRLGIAEGDVEASINANGKEYVDIRFSCGVCMTKRDRVLVYVNKNKFPISVKEARRKAAEQVLNAHETCLKISSPAEKRTWLEEAQLAKEHDMAKKRRTELDN